MEGKVVLAFIMSEGTRLPVEEVITLLPSHVANVAVRAFGVLSNLEEEVLLHFEGLNVVRAEFKLAYSLNVMLLPFTCLVLSYSDRLEVDFVLGYNELSLVSLLFGFQIKTRETVL
jgi:hypothetical protein